MLQQLFIRNFALIDSCEMTFSAGLNVLSGETGAGKSILIDALGLQLGDRADGDWIRHGESRCEVQTVFSLPPDAQLWLEEHELDDEPNDSCQLRRTVSRRDNSKSSKSQAYINARPVPVSQLKALGAQLVTIHGQHANQALMRPESQLDLLDGFAETILKHDFIEAKQRVQESYTALHLLKQKTIALNNDDELSLNDRLDLLTFQISELEALDIRENEFDELITHQKKLTSNQQLSSTAQQLIELVSESDHALTQKVAQALSLAQELIEHDAEADEIIDLLEQASVHIDETSLSLNQYTDSLTLDPESLHDVENRMSELHEMARKHRIEPNQLLEKLNQLQSALETTNVRIKEISTLDADLAKAEQSYQKYASALTALRTQSAKELSLQVKSQLAKLSMDKADFEVAFSIQNTPSALGQDSVVFMIAPNPGQAPKPLHKIASGGELSRVSLAIQVASINEESGITLIFDEVDAGIGGGTAEIVGQLLKTLSQFHQILCVTHLAQVAAYADRHIKIEKRSTEHSTSTHFHVLLQKDREEELARMSGGINPDHATKIHAQQLLTQANEYSEKLKQQSSKH